MDLAELQNTINQLQAQLDTLQADNTKLNTRITELTNANTALDAMNKELWAKVPAAQAITETQAEQLDETNELRTIEDISKYLAENGKIR